MYSKNSADIDVVLLDLTMPDMDGHETFCELRRIRKDLPVVLCSGYSIENAREGFDKADLPGFIQKPFLLEGLVAALSQAMNAPGQTWTKEVHANSRKHKLTLESDCSERTP